MISIDRNEKLISLRLQKNKTQMQVAEEVGISTSALAMIETGQRNGKDSTKKKIASYYGKTVDELFFTH